MAVRYVPILWGRQGEYHALRELADPVREAILPLVRIPNVPWDFVDEQPREPLGEHLSKSCRYLEDCWSSGQQIAIDLEEIEGGDVEGRGVHPLAFVLDSCRESGVLALPVVGIDRELSYMEAARECAERDGRGAILRIQGGDIEEVRDLGEAVERLLSQIAIPTQDIDLVLDLGAVSSEQAGPIRIAAASILRSLPNKDGWRRIAFAATGFPENLSGFPANRLSATPRVEWDLYQALVEHLGVERGLLFSDYAVAHPVISEIDPRLMRMSANIRYTVEHEWLLARGRDVRRHGFDQTQQLCQWIRERPEFRGAEFSWGDKWISDRAAGEESPGSATTWRKVATNHHVTFVSDQAASLVST